MTCGHLCGPTKQPLELSTLALGSASKQRHACLLEQVPAPLRPALGSASRACCRQVPIVIDVDHGLHCLVQHRCHKPMSYTWVKDNGSVNTHQLHRPPPPPPAQVASTCRPHVHSPARPPALVHPPFAHLPALLASSTPRHSARGPTGNNSCRCSAHQHSLPRPPT